MSRLCGNRGVGQVFQPDGSAAGVRLESLTYGIVRAPVGMTLVETLLALAIVSMIAVAMAGLATAVQVNNRYTEGHAVAVQHARVALERIERMASEATANEQFPGFLVIEDYVGTWRFPDTLVVWHPRAGTSAADPRGLPRFSELVLYYPEPRQPAQFLEVTLPDDTRTVPSPDDAAAWTTEIARIKDGRLGQRVVVTDRVRACVASNGSNAAPRGAVRFESRLRPSADEWSQYRKGTLPWQKLSWVQGIYGSRTGLRQAWLRIELQLTPRGSADSPDTEPAAAFFGSAALYYEMRQ